MKNFAAVENNDELQQRAKKPEVGVADDRKFQSAVRTHQAPLRSEIGKNVEAEFLGWITHWHARDQQAGEQPKQRETGKNRAGDGFASTESLRKIRAEDRARDNGDEGREFENAVAPGKFFGRKEFGQQTVFRRPKNRSLRAGQKNYREGEIRT